VSGFRYAAEMPTKRPFLNADSQEVFGHPLRVGLYARVSTVDQQTLPLQIRTLRDYAAKRGWSITTQIKEVASGAAERARRQPLIDAARRREIDLVLVWRLDRWGPLRRRSRLHFTRTDRAGSWVRIAHRGARSNDACRPRHGRPAGGICGIRAGRSCANAFARA
jgi:predicted site-specific integrase-resolvase